MPDYELAVSFNAKVQFGTNLDDETDLVDTVKEILQEWAGRVGVTLSNMKVEVA